MSESKKIAVNAAKNCIKWARKFRADGDIEYAAKAIADIKWWRDFSRGL